MTNKTKYEPLVSVIIPAFNEEDRIVRCLESIQNQTHTNLEIIVVDDHSTDGTYQKIKEMAAKDSRIQYFQTPGGAPRRKNFFGWDINAGWKARAYGFSAAKGGWITTQDADDYSLLNRIEVQLDLANKYNATLITVNWQRATTGNLNKRLDVHRLIADHGEKEFLVTKDTINPLPKLNRGPLMIEPLHQYLPFFIKWFKYTRPLFWGKGLPYPGADNCMLFRREVIAAGVNFRSRNQRTWGVSSGRGTGRDFVHQAAHVFQNSYSFNIPLYIWDVQQDNPLVPAYPEYLID